VRARVYVCELFFIFPGNWFPVENIGILSYGHYATNTWSVNVDVNTMVESSLYRLSPRFNRRLMNIYSFDKARFLYFLHRFVCWNLFSLSHTRTCMHICL